MTDFNKGKIVISRQLGQLLGVLPVCSGKYMPKVLQGWRIGGLVLGSAWVVKASPFTKEFSSENC